MLTISIPWMFSITNDSTISLGLGGMTQCLVMVQKILQGESTLAGLARLRVVHSEHSSRILCSVSRFSQGAE